MRFRQCFVLPILLVAFATTPAHGDDAHRTAPDFREKVDAIFSAWDKSTSPGCALGVFAGGEMVYSHGYGMANLDHGIALSSRSVFDLGSTSKQFTALSIVILVQRGELALDDDIRKYLPEMPRYPRTITIRHLLQHSSGIRDYLTLMELAGTRFDDVSTAEDALALLSRQQETNFPPGAEFLYSNSGYFLLSLIVKRASGQSLARFAEANIFAPLGMNHTHFHDDHTLIVPERSTGYAPAPDGAFRINVSNFEQTGDGAVYTTVEDLLLWDRNFHDPKVGGPELVRQLQIPGTLADGKPLDYAMGLLIGEYQGLKTVSHSGAWAGYSSELLRFPEERFSVACLCNLEGIDPEVLARRVADVFLAERMKPEQIHEPSQADSPPIVPSPVAPSFLTPARMTEFVGDYSSDELQTSYGLRLEHGRLILRRRNTPERPLIPILPNVFSDGTLTLTFNRDNHKRLTGFTLAAGRVRNLRFLKSVADPCHRRTPKKR